MYSCLLCNVHITNSTNSTSFEVSLILFDPILHIIEATYRAAILICKEQKIILCIWMQFVFRPSDYWLDLALLMDYIFIICISFVHEWKWLKFLL